MSNQHNFAAIVLLSIYLSVGCARSNQVYDPRLVALEDVVWSNPDSAITILSTFSVNYLPECDQNMWHLWHELASLKTSNPIHPDSIMRGVVVIFKRRMTN